MSNKNDGNVWDFIKAFSMFIGNNLVRYMVMNLIVWSLVCCVRYSLMMWNGKF